MCRLEAHKAPSSPINPVKTVQQMVQQMLPRCVANKCSTNAYQIAPCRTGHGTDPENMIERCSENVRIFGVISGHQKPNPTNKYQRLTKAGPNRTMYFPSFARVGPFRAKIGKQSGIRLSYLISGAQTSLKTHTHTRNKNRNTSMCLAIFEHVSKF